MQQCNDRFLPPRSATQCNRFLPPRKVQQCNRCSHFGTLHLSLKMEPRRVHMLAVAVFISAGGFPFPVVATSGRSLHSTEAATDPDNSPGQRRDNVRTDNSPDSGRRISKTQYERERLVHKHTIRHRQLILDYLGLPENRSEFRIPDSSFGSEGFANRSMELLRSYERSQGITAKKEETPKKHEKPNVDSRATIKTILFGEKVSSATDDRVVLFRLNKNQNKDYLVTEATVTVLVQSARTGNGNGSSATSSKPEADRATIRIYALTGNRSDGGGGDLITELSIMLSRDRQLQRLLLPTSFVQEALDSQTEGLLLRIVCDRCVQGHEADQGQKVREKAGRSKRKEQRLGDRKKRLRESGALANTPYLTINSRQRRLLRRTKGFRRQRLH